MDITPAAAVTAMAAVDTDARKLRVLRLFGAVVSVSERHGSSKFIVRPMPATLIRDGVAMGLQFIKNRRLIVQERDPQPLLSRKSPPHGKASYT